MELKLKGKNAIITGGANGIGFACCEELAKEGVNILIADINEEAAHQAALSIEKYGVKSFAVKTDVCNLKSVKNMVNKGRSTFGRIDILINSAGIVTISKLSNVTEKEWDMVMDINAKGVFVCTQTVMNAMIEDNVKGKIVNISSQAGKKPVNMEAPYSASKAAVNMLTQSFALYGASRSINVNAVCPGSIENDLNKRITEQRAKILGIQQEEFLKNTLKNTPLGRQGKPEEIAYMVVYLCSYRADFMTGQAINITGGRLFN